MTCKNCLHFEVCDSGRHIGEFIEDDGIYSDGVEKECPAFKNKTDFVKVRHGEWEKMRYLEGCVNNYQHTCNACGKSYFDNNANSNYPYCPNCGAKMDGKGD